MGAPRVLLADDHAMLVGAIENLLAGEFDVVGRVNDGRALVTAAESLKPDIIVLDISMPLLNGLEAGRQIKQRLPHVRLVFMTMNEDPDVAVEAFRAGAAGYLLKRSAVSELTTALREVMQGRTYITPLVAKGLVGSLLNPEPQGASVVLTSRQREVLQLVAEGHSMKEIAQLLNLTPRTVAFHKYRMMEQLGVKSTAELIQYAVKHQLV
jgi:DNA-binding NarL/FixJ family response regulator